MEMEFSCRQDTIKATNPLKNLPGLPEPGELNIDRSAPVPLIPLPLREILDKSQNTINMQTQPAPPTADQLRYWWWQREKNLLVDKSRYMEPRTDLQLTLPYIKEERGVRLPARQINRFNYDWLTLVLLLVLVLFATVRNTWNKYLGHLFQSVINYSTSSRLYQEKNNSILHGAFRLEIIFYLVFSVYVFQLINFFRLDFPFHNFSRYLLSMVYVISYFLIKKMIYMFLGFLVERTSVTGEYLFNMDNYNRVAGLLLLPVVSVIAFYPLNDVALPVIIGAIVSVFLYFLLLARGFLIILKKQFSIFYLFLYFCTLEFVPLVLLYKILIV